MLKSPLSIKRIVPFGLKNDEATKLSERRRVRSGLALAAIILFSLLAATFIVGAYNRPLPSEGAEPARKVPSQPPENALSPQAAAKRVGTVIVKAGFDGFEPDAISQPQGQFFLAVEKQCGPQQLSLQLIRQGSGLAQSMSIQQNDSEWDELLDLAPGVYILTEANHPDWICAITITP